MNRRACPNEVRAGWFLSTTLKGGAGRYHRSARHQGGSCRGADNSTMFAGGPIVVCMGRCRFIGATLRTLTAAAFGLEVVGGPGWADSDHFEVEGVAPDISTATQGQLTEMLRQLLTDRFNLKFHRETKEVSGYALT